MALIPQGARILVSRQAPKETVLPGGLVMPASAGAAKDPVERGEIVMSGQDVSETFCGFAPGRIALFKRSKGVEVTDGPARYYVVDVADVLAVEAEPAQAPSKALQDFDSLRLALMKAQDSGAELSK